MRLLSFEKLAGAPSRGENKLKPETLQTHFRWNTNACIPTNPLCFTCSWYS